MTKNYRDKIEELKSELSLNSPAVASHIAASIFLFFVVIGAGIILKASVIGIVAAVSILGVVLIGLLYKQLLDKNNLCVEIFKGLVSEIMFYEDVENKILGLLDLLKIPAILENPDGVIRYNSNAVDVAQKQDIHIENNSHWLINNVRYRVVKFRLRQDYERDIIALFSEDGNADEIITFLSKSTLSTIVINQKYDSVTYNESFRAMLSLEKDDKCNLLEIIPDDEKEKFLEIIDGIKKIGSHKAHDFKILKSDKIVSMHIAPLYIKQELHFICNILDVTARTASKVDFLHTQKIQAVGQLAGSIAHDFNNLLTAMIGFCDLLFLRHGPSEPSFYEIMQIKQNADRAAGLVRQLLAFSRKQVLSLEILDLNEIIAGLSGLLSRLIGGSNIELSFEYGKNVAPVMADRGQLEQIIINLAINARDAMPKSGKLLVKVSTMVVDGDFNEGDYYTPIGDSELENRVYTVLQIADTGSGIPNEIINNIFEPFFSTKDFASGTGLGLATVYGIVKQIEGHIRIDTKIGEGTTFYILLNAKEKQVAIKDQGKKLARSNKHVDSIFMKDEKYHGKILVVEDEDPVRLFEVQALKSKGYNVIDTADAETAMRYLELEGKSIDIVVTDIVMPGISGPEMVEKIRDIYPHIKFIFTSGYAEDAVDYLHENKHHFLAKPFSLNDLAKMIQMLLKEKNNE